MNAILFDFEGTIVDFQWKLSKAVQEARTKLSLLGINIEQRNYALLYNEALKIAEEVGNYNLVRRTLDEIYDKYDMDALTRWRLRDDAHAISKWIEERNIETALVTNVGRKAIDLALKKFDLNFDVTVTRNEMRYLKPSPYGLEKAMKALGIERAIFVGDSISDIIAAKQAGIPVAVIRGGESDIEEINKAAPDYVLNDLLEVMEILKK